MDAKKSERGARTVTKWEMRGQQRQGFKYSTQERKVDERTVSKEREGDARTVPQEEKRYEDIIEERDGKARTISLKRKVSDEGEKMQGRNLGMRRECEDSIDERKGNARSVSRKGRKMKRK